jgi:enoyl-CoA hydratase/carnithine racemase
MPSGEIDEALLYEVQDGLAIVTLNRPQVLNALTREMIDRLQAIADEVEHDPQVFALAVTGAGRAFCSGLDVSLLAKAADSGGAEARVPSGELPGLFTELLKVSKPVIAAVNGVAAVGGFVLAMMCDLRFASEDASFVIGMSNRGLIAEHGTSWLVPRQIGLSRALDLMWSSRKVDAHEALRLGLVDRVTPAGGELEAVKAYVADLRARVSPRAVAEMKAQIYGHLEMSFADAVRDSMDRMMQALTHSDVREGARAFVERRPPAFEPWKGR